MSNRKELLLPIMKSRIIKETDELPLMEDFFSIQGEGYFSGQAALSKIKFYASSGNITSGDFYLYGLNKS